jgi:hypothetical protein
MSAYRFNEDSIQALLEQARKAEVWACISYLNHAGFEDAAKALKQREQDADQDQK